MNVTDLLENAACACQEKKLLEPHVQGALLRTIYQWLKLNKDTKKELRKTLEQHPNYQR